MWRYEALLPVVPGAGSRPGLQPGFTRLVRADNLAAELGARAVWVKDDSGNPTHSFKDRVVAVALENGRRLGYTTIACASTGNLANAVAAAAARAGLESVVFVPSNLEAGKIVTTAVYGGTLVAIDGNYDDVNRLCSEIASNRDWGFVNVNLRPYYAEGSKTVGYEVAEQLGWRLPDAVVSPVASGSLLTKVDKAFREFVDLGLVEDHAYQVFGAQATGCSPVAQAFRAGHDVIRPVKPDTIAKSLAIGNPADGPYALDVVRRTGGAIADVSDDGGRRGDQAPRAHRGHLRRDGGRRGRRDLPQAAGRGTHRSGGRGGAPQHRRRPQDPRRGRAHLAAHVHHLPVLRRLRNPLRRSHRMSISVKIPTILRTYTGGSADVTVTGATLSEALADLDVQFPGIGARVLDDEGKLRRFVNVYVNDDDVRFLEDLQTPTPDGASISIIPAVAGG